jgi:hypothetical protein
MTPVKDTTVTGDTVRVTEKTQVCVSITYNSAMNYYGRVDSLRSKGIYPSAGIYLKNGLYANASFVFIQNSLGSQYAATLLEAGYRFNNSKGNWSGSLSADKYYYQANTGLVESAIREVVAGSLSNINKIVNVTVGADVKFSSSIDPGIQLGLDHTIRFSKLLGDDDVLVIDPSADVNGGSQHFTQTFFEQKNFLVFPGGEEMLTSNSQLFSVLDYEFSLPVVYRYRKLTFILDPVYILPQNVLDANGQPLPSYHLFDMILTAKLTL